MRVSGVGCQVSGVWCRVSGVPVCGRLCRVRVAGGAGVCVCMWRIVCGGCVEGIVALVCSMYLSLCVCVVRVSWACVLSLVCVCVVCARRVRVCDNVCASCVRREASRVCLVCVVSASWSCVWLHVVCVRCACASCLCVVCVFQVSDGSSVMCRGCV